MYQCCKFDQFGLVLGQPHRWRKLCHLEFLKFSSKNSLPFLQLQKDFLLLQNFHFRDPKQLSCNLKQYNLKHVLLQSFNSCWSYSLHENESKGIPRALPNYSLNILALTARWRSSDISKKVIEIWDIPYAKPPKHIAIKTIFICKILFWLLKVKIYIEKLIMHNLLNFQKFTLLNSRSSETKSQIHFKDQNHEYQ